MSGLSFVVDVGRMQLPSSAARKRATLRNPTETYGRISTFTEQSLGLISLFYQIILRNYQQFVV